MDALNLQPDTAVAKALMLPFEQGGLAWPDAGPVLFLCAQADVVDASRVGQVVCQQDFKPFADRLQQAGFTVADPPAGTQFELVLLLLPRSRDARRILFARAMRFVTPGGTVLCAVANREGARSAEDDLRKLAGSLEHLSKHKCRVFWTRGETRHIDDDLLPEWEALDAPRPADNGLISRPGLFAWNRIDAASALLASQLPDDLAGRVADLGSGAGYLSLQVLERCPQVKLIDLFEADARAVPMARINILNAMTRLGRNREHHVYWHDVTSGIAGTYDAVVTNPPFHQGRAEQPELGQVFIKVAAQALRDGGMLWMVANRQLPYEQTLGACFRRVDTVTRQDGFKVIRAEK